MCAGAGLHLDKEIKFHISVLPRITGLHHFKNGITMLKQVCGRTQRDVQQYLVAIIAGGVPLDVVIAICMLIEFRYLLKLQPLLYRHEIGFKLH